MDRIPEGATEILAKAQSIQKKVWLFAIAASFLFALTAVWAIKNDTGQNNLYVHQAEAFLRGELDIPQWLPDVAEFNGKYYVPFPPAPAILLLPFVATFGEIRPPLIALALTVVSVVTLVIILGKLHIEPYLILFLALGLFLGTGYWFSITASAWVWYFAHVVAVTFLLLAIHQALVKGRGATAGLFLGFAFLSRQTTIFSAVFILAAVLRHPSNRTQGAKLKRIIGFGASLIACVGAYLVFNAVRFGSIFDTGYTYLQFPNNPFFETRLARFGLFHPAYIPFNFAYMFLQGPHIEFEQFLLPVAMDPFGTSLVFASPFVLLAIFAKGNKSLTYSAWVTVSLSLLPILLYYGNGHVQYNTQRYSLDFLPVLTLLVAFSLENVDRRILPILVMYSVLLNVVALILLPIISRLAGLG